MQVIVKGHHIHVSDHLKDATVHKLEKLNRFFDRIQKVEVEFSHDKNLRAPTKHSVEVLLTTPIGAVRAHAKAIDPTTAVDEVVDKLERQIKRLKEKVAGHPKGGAKNASPRFVAARIDQPPPLTFNGAGTAPEPELSDLDISEAD